MRKINIKGKQKTTCSKCDKPIEESRKNQRYCKSCHAGSMRLSRINKSILNGTQKIGKKKTCSKCGNPLEQSRVDKYRYCLSCHAEYNREKVKKKKYSELSSGQLKKSNCRSYTRVMVKRGKLIKLPCSVCGDTNSQAHHHDYNKPLEINWLCKKHHLELHNNEKQNA